MKRLKLPNLRIFKLLTLILFVLASGLMVVPASAQRPLSCVGVNFNVDGGQQWGSLSVPPPDFGGIFDDPIIVRPEITLENAVNVPSIDQVRFSYRREGAGWVQLNNLVFIYTGDYGAGASRYVSQGFSFPVDMPGQWEYTIEFEAQDITLTGTGNGCPTSASPTIPFTVTAEELDNSVVAAGCGRLENAGYDVTNRFTCQYLSNTSNSGFRGEVKQTNCGPGFVPDQKGCEVGRSFFGEDIEDAGSVNSQFCMSCITQEQANYVAAGHLDACDINAETPCTQERSLECLPTASGDVDINGNPVSHRCLYTEPILSSGSPCYTRAAECASNLGFNSCQNPAAGTYIGVCTNSVTSPEADCGDYDDPDEYCKQRLNADNAYCQFLVGASQCEIRGRETPSNEDPNDPNSPTGITNYAYASDQFGVINCPYSFPTVLPEWLAELVGRVGINLGQQALRRLTQEEITERRKNDEKIYFIADPASNQDERREFYQCASCIDDGGTWTGIGCIVTTIEGLFNSLLRIILGVMGGVALIRLIILGYQYQFAGEDKIKPSVQDILATLGGLLLVLFSVVILRFIGVNLLDIVPPGFF